MVMRAPRSPANARKSNQAPFVPISVKRRLVALTTPSVFTMWFSSALISTFSRICIAMIQST